MNFFLLTGKGYFHFDYDGRRKMLDCFFPEKHPKLALFYYGQVYNNKACFLEKFVPGRDIIILSSADTQENVLIYSDEALRQRIKIDEPWASEGDTECIKDIENTKKCLTENQGQIIYNALKNDTANRTTYEVIRDLAIQHNWKYKNLKN